MPFALLALAVGAFGIGTTEFVVVGLLPQIAGDLHVTVPTAGLLISGYALSVVVGAPLITVAGSRIPRKAALIALMGLFTAGNLLCAVAGSYQALMAGRVVTALCHGAFFGLGSVVAADLVEPRRRASAIALMFTGLTVANVLGVPMGTALGQHFGWRSTFWAVTCVGVLAMGSLCLLPSLPRAGAIGLRGELTVLARPPVWLALLTTVFGFGAVFASFTFFAPMLTDVSGFSSSAVTWLLILFGVGLCLGNFLGGRAADRRLMPSLCVILAALSAVLAVFTFTVHSRPLTVVTVLVFGVVGFATVPPLQTAVLSRAEGAPTLASAVNIGAFNLGNALGAWLSGLAVDAGLGYTAPNWIGALMAAAGLLVVALSMALDRRPAPTHPGRAEPEPPARVTAPAMPPGNTGPG